MESGVIYTSYRLGRMLDQMMHPYRKGRFHGSDDKFRCAVWLARVFSHGIVEIYTAFRHMWGNPASGSPVAGSVFDT
jgi:hypothetical protein